MSTKTDLYLGRGPGAHWLGSLQWDCDPENLLRVPPGRLALTARDETTYRDAVDDLLTVWVDEDIGDAHVTGGVWPWLCPTSHRSDWIIAFDEGVVFVTVGGGSAWERIDPDAPTPPFNDNDVLGPPDLRAWLDNPSAPPSVPFPLMRVVAARPGEPHPTGNEEP